MIAKKATDNYSEDYKIIKEKIAREWADWKIDFYNNSFATSLHAKKIIKIK